MMENTTGHILVTDDSLTVRMMLKDQLEAAGYRVTVLEDGEQCVQFFESGHDRPDLVLLDLLMPGMDGIAVLNWIKGNAQLGYVPVILLTALGDVNDRVRGLDQGADDYVAKPFEPQELMARVRAQLRIKRLQDELEAKNVQLEVMATTDPLTGVANRGHIETILSNEVARAQRYEQGLAMVMIDIDHFKPINDGYGHPFGDRVIRETARVLRDAARQTDTVGRYGGEEFMVVLPETDLKGAMVLAERMRTNVEALEFDPHPVRATLSVGVAVWNPDMGTWEALISCADEALYQAKDTGRNRTCSFAGNSEVKSS